MLVTHYQRLLDHVVPDKVHVLAARAHRCAAAIARWRMELERRGYDWVIGEAA